MTYEHSAYENNNLKFVSQTTPSSNQTVCRVTTPPKYVCPVIFIPGIMGSNIVDDQGQEVWFPPNSTLHGLGASIYGGIWRSASDRQKQLNPETTKVSNTGEINLKKNIFFNRLKDFDEKKARARGWGTVWWQGYGEILLYLEKHLNQELITGESADQSEQDCFFGTEEWEKIVDIDSNSQTKIQDLQKEWNAHNPFELLTKELHGKLADYNFPVFALGYNWLQSNDQSANLIAQSLLGEVQAQIKKEYPKQTFKKYLIVSHSMGGLVTRSLLSHSEIKDDVLGIVHGVMPATGAPTVYQRFCNGWDGYLTTGNVTDAIAKYVFGDSSEKLTPVLANAPGGLQLLPFSNFMTDEGSTKWLKLKALDLNGNEVVAELPKSDPYDEIYFRTDTWWSMIDTKKLDPAGILAGELEEDTSGEFSSVADYYLKNIKIVQKFHNSIIGKYHPNTYAHYGNDTAHMAFSEVLWETTQKINISSPEDLIEYYGKSTGSQLEDSNELLNQVDVATPIGSETKEFNANPIILSAHKDYFTSDGVRTVTTDTGEKITFRLRIKPTSAGDGTVCHESGADVKTVNIKNYYVMKGFEHSASYGNTDVQLNTLYNISKVMESI